MARSSKNNNTFNRKLLAIGAGVGMIVVLILVGIFSRNLTTDVYNPGMSPSPFASPYASPGTSPSPSPVPSIVCSLTLAQIQAIRAQIAVNQNKIDSDISQQQQLSEEMNNLAISYDALVNKVTSATTDEEFNSITEQLQSLNNTIEGLNKQYQTLADDISSLTATINQLQNQLLNCK